VAEQNTTKGASPFGEALPFYADAVETFAI
jgi:hypothetical protein